MPSLHTRRGPRRAILAHALPIAAALAGAACSPSAEARLSAPNVEPHTAPSPAAHPAAGKIAAAQRDSIFRVRAATAAFRDLAVAQAAGYTSQFPAGCAASPDGAQGIHYLAPALVDAKIELLKPELVMYEPLADGSMELVGVDYVVPFAQWTSSEPPKLLGVPFMRNEPLGVWALHIWAQRENPSGTFAMWNPRVTCAFAR